MKKNLEQQEKELEDKIKAFEAERETWEEQNRFDDQYVTLLYVVLCYVATMLQFHMLCAPFMLCPVEFVTGVEIVKYHGKTGT